MTAVREYCAECRKMASSHIETRTETHTSNGQTVTLDNVQVRVCDSCRRDRVDSDLDDVTLNRLYALTGRTPQP